MSKRDAGSTAKIPFFGELPWIGAAFGRKEATESETELVIMITPLPGAPLKPGEVPPGGPGQFTTVPTDVELMFHNHLEVPKIGDECSGSFNCQACRQNGRCALHPNGCHGAHGGIGGPGCGTEGCNTLPSQNAGLIGPVISPAAPGSSRPPQGHQNFAPATGQPGFPPSNNFAPINNFPPPNNFNPASQRSNTTDGPSTDSVLARPVSQRRASPPTSTTPLNSDRPGLLKPLFR